jgi:hypothetical protein
MSGIVMLKQLRFAAVPLIAGTEIMLTTASVWAFSQQTLAPSGNYNFNYSGPDDKAKLGESTNKSESNNPGFYFSIERGQTGPFGFYNFGDSNNATFPDYYARPFGNGN